MGAANIYQATLYPLHAATRTQDQLVTAVLYRVVTPILSALHPLSMKTRFNCYSGRTDHVPKFKSCNTR